MGFSDTNNLVVKVEKEVEEEVETEVDTEVDEEVQIPIVKYCYKIYDFLFENVTSILSNPFPILNKVNHQEQKHTGWSDQIEHILKFKNMPVPCEGAAWSL